MYLEALENQNEAPGLLWEAPASQEILGTFAARGHDALENTSQMAGNNNACPYPRGRDGFALWNAIQEAKAAGEGVQQKVPKCRGSMQNSAFRQLSHAQRRHRVMQIKKNPQRAF